MSKSFNWFTVAAVAVGLSMAGNVFATNGYFTHGNGTKNKAMAGSGIALPEDAIDVTNNPAVAPFVGDQLTFGAAVFSPVRKYRTSDSLLNGQMGAFTIGPNKITSDSEYFVIPHIAKSWQRDNGLAFALSMYGRGGMNTDWDGGTATFDPDGPAPNFDVMTIPGTYGDAAFGGKSKAGVNFSQAFVDFTVAKQFTPNVSLGLSGVMVYQWFSAKGVHAFAPYTKTYAQSFMETGMPAMPENLTNNGRDYSLGFGAKLGAHFDFNEQFSLGIMYQTEIDMDEFDDYSDLFAERGGMDIPADLKVGLTFKPNENFSFNLDIEQIWYSDIGSVGNPIANIFQCPTAMQGGMDLESCLGGKKGAGFGWDDMTVYKTGMKWTNNEDWTWRFGYSYGEQPISKSEMTFNILAPGVMEHHITAGFTLERTKGRELNVALMYAPEVDQTGPQNFDPTQNVTFEMYQWELEASYSIRF